MLIYSVKGIFPPGPSKFVYKRIGMLHIIQEKAPRLIINCLLGVGWLVGLGGLGWFVVWVLVCLCCGFFYETNNTIKEL